MVHAPVRRFVRDRAAPQGVPLCLRRPLTRRKRSIPWATEANRARLAGSGES